MTINELLKKYNAAAPKPLKAWKGSKAALQAKLDAVKPAKVAKVKRTTINGTLSVVQIASELSINPKVARAKLRRRGLVATNGRWASVKRDSAEHKTIIEQLGG